MRRYCSEVWLAYLPLQPYNQVLSSELVLCNTGKVDLDFTALGVSDKKDLSPGEVLVEPSKVNSIIILRASLNYNLHVLRLHVYEQAIVFVHLSLSDRKSVV